MKKFVVLFSILFVIILSSCGSNSENQMGVSENENHIINMSIDEKKALLKKVNMATKTAFENVVRAASNLHSDGTIAEKASSGKFGIIKISDLDKNDYYQNALLTSFADCGITEGYLNWEINDHYLPIYIQYSESIDQTIVGQFPDPEKDPEITHTIGTRFNDKTNSSTIDNSLQTENRAAEEPAKELITSHSAVNTGDAQELPAK